MRSRSLVVLFFILSLAVSPAKANVASTFGFGPLSSATGGTSFLVGNYDAFSVYSAPAALGYISDVKASLGYFSMTPKLKAVGSVVLNSNGTRGEFSESGVLGGTGQTLGLTLPIGSKNRPLTVGAAFYLPSTSVARVSGSPVNYPFYTLYSDISRNAFYVFGIGYRIWGPLAVGVNLRSSIKSLADYQLRADNTINYSASAVEARSQSRVSVSLMYDASLKGEPDPGAIGLMYRAESTMETKLNADVTAFVNVKGVLNSISAYSPAEWVLALSQRFDSIGLTGSFDATWVKWSGYASPYGSGNINSYVIGDLRKEANFKDVFVPRIGFENHLGRLGAIQKIAARVGYFYYPSPVPDQVSDSNFVDANRHAFTTGLGLGFSNPWQGSGDRLINLDMYFQYNSLANRQIIKNSSTNGGAPGYQAGGKILLYGLAATLNF